MEKQFLSELFHYNRSSKKHAGLRKGLDEYRFILLVSSDAIKALKNGDLEKFDALVGENACQIRAIKISIIASGDLTYLDDLLKRLTKALLTTDLLLDQVSMNALMQSGASLKEVMDLHSLDIQVCKDTMFCIQSYILSEMKEDVCEKVSLRSLCKEEKAFSSKLRYIAPQVTPSFMENLSSRLKKLLSKSSVSFVTEAALSLQNPILAQALSENIQHYNTRPCTPMFWTYQTLLLHAQKNDVPILLHAKFLVKQESAFEVTEEAFLYFKPCPKTRQYIKTVPKKDDLATPACVVEGAVYSSSSKQSWINSIDSYSITDIILAGAADHRQYPNPEYMIDIEDVEFKGYKQMAKEDGFSIDNPEMFFIRHVYSSQVGKKHSAFLRTS